MKRITRAQRADIAAILAARGYAVTDFVFSTANETEHHNVITVESERFTADVHLKWYSKRKGGYIGYVMVTKLHTLTWNQLEKVRKDMPLWGNNFNYVDVAGIADHLDKNTTQYIDLYLRADELFDKKVVDKGTD